MLGIVEVPNPREDLIPEAPGVVAECHLSHSVSLNGPPRDS
jgi:hypothetical protein